MIVFVQYISKKHNYLVLSINNLPVVVVISLNTFEMCKLDSNIFVSKSNTKYWNERFQTFYCLRPSFYSIKAVYDPIEYETRKLQYSILKEYFIIPEIAAVIFDYSNQNSNKYYVPWKFGVM